MRLRVFIVILTALGALCAAGPQARAQDPATTGAIVGVTAVAAVGLMARRDSRNGLTCLNYRGVMPSRAVCGFKARSRFYEAARSPEHPVGPVSWLGPGYAPPKRSYAPLRIAAPGGCGAGGQIAPCGVAPGPYSNGWRR
jgi:hypothetical protein